MKNYLGQRKSFEFLLRKKQIFGLGRIKVEEYIWLIVLNLNQVDK